MLAYVCKRIECVRCLDETQLFVFYIHYDPRAPAALLPPTANYVMPSYCSAIRTANCLDVLLPNRLNEGNTPCSRMYANGSSASVALTNLNSSSSTSIMTRAPQISWYSQPKITLCIRGLDKCTTSAGCWLTSRKASIIKSELCSSTKE